MKKYILQCIAVLMLLASQSFAIAADDDSVKIADDKVSLNFIDADIESVVKAIGLITNKNFLLDPRVKGTISIKLHKQENNILRLEVADNGIGKSGVVHGTGFGGQLISMLTHQLNGSMKEEIQNGTTIIFEFKVNKSA